MSATEMSSSSQQEAPPPDLSAAYAEWLSDIKRAVETHSRIGDAELPLGGDSSAHFNYKLIARHYGIADDRIRRPIDLASIMRTGTEPPEMLVPGFLVKGELHWVYAEAEGAKTWLLLWNACYVLNSGGTVVWVDEELGQRVIAERLAALGADPEAVAARFVYFAFPSWGNDATDKQSWQLLLGAYRPDLVVFDTATDALANADLDENKGIDVTGWVKDYCEPARAAGAAVAVLDHTTKTTGGKPTIHPVASRAKRAKAKVMLALKTVEPFDRDKVGKVLITRTKNTLSAAIPNAQTFKAGGDGCGRFVWEAIAGIDDRGAAEAANYVHVRDRVLDYIKNNGPAKKTKIKDEVTGKASLITRVMEELSEAPDFWGVQIGTEGRAIVFSWVGDTDGE